MKNITKEQIQFQSPSSITVTDREGPETFPTYLSNLRVKNAASLLLNNQLSITECAYKAGFGSTTAFNKAFHEITGYSPRDFRQLYRK